MLLLLWLHILAAIGWMGTAMFPVMVLTPSMPSVSGAARAELMMKLSPRLIRYVTAFATLTLAAGILLAYSFATDNLGYLSPTNPDRLKIMVGTSLALAAYVLALGLGLRPARKIVRILEGQRESQQGPLPEVAKLQKRMRMTATTVMAPPDVIARVYGSSLQALVQEITRSRRLQRS